MIQIVLATSNEHKVSEINAIANQHGINFIKVQDGFDPVEDGVTFEENSAIKAKEASCLMYACALADDAGLCVDALGGRPGIHSARYASTQSEKIEKLFIEKRNKIALLYKLSKSLSEKRKTFAKTLEKFHLIG